MSSSLANAKENAPLLDASCTLPIEQPRNEEEVAGKFSEFFFNYAYRILEIGLKAPLQFSNLPLLRKVDDANNSFLQFDHVWKKLGARNAEKNKAKGDNTSRSVDTELNDMFRTKRSILEVLVRWFGWKYAHAVMLTFIFATLVSCGPLFLEQVIIYVNHPQRYTLTRGIISAFLLLLPTVCATFCTQHSDHIMNRLALRARGALITAVFQKSLRLSHESALKYDVGYVANLIGTDCQRPADYAFFLNWMFASPIIIFISIGFLAWKTGVAAIPAVGIMIVTLALGFRISYIMVIFERRRSASSDLRMKEMSVLLHSMELIKLFAWERYFLQRVVEQRDAELGRLLRIFYARGASSVVGGCTDTLIACGVFGTYMATTSGRMEPATAFSIMGILYSIRTPFVVMIILVPSITQLVVSLRRVEAFLLAPERDASYVAESSYAALLHPARAAATLPVNNTNRFVSTIKSSSALAVTTTNSHLEAPLPPTSSSDPPFIRIEQASFVWDIHHRDHHQQQEKGEKDTAATPAGIAAAATPAGIAPAGIAAAGVAVGANENDGDDKQSSSSNTPFSSPQSKLVLHNISFNAEGPQLVALVGRVGSGKSSLLQAILGNLIPVHVSPPSSSATASAADIISFEKENKTLVRVGAHSMALVEQQPWILNGTVRENITIGGPPGSPFNAMIYHTALEVSCLIEDIVLLPAGDETEIGERGTNLSGGQKQRLSIARAVYSQADVYLLDDPLSALDPLVAAKVFHRCFAPLTGVLRNKLRLLATHHLQFLPFTDRVVVLNKGEIVEEYQPGPQDLARPWQLHALSATSTSSTMLRQLMTSVDQQLQEGGGDGMMAGEAKGEENEEEKGKADKNNRKGLDVNKPCPTSSTTTTTTAADDNDDEVLFVVESTKSETASATEAANAANYTKLVGVAAALPVDHKNSAAPFDILSITLKEDGDVNSIATKQKKEGRLGADEVRFTGQVKKSIFVRYIGSGLCTASLATAGFLFLFSMEAGARVLCDGWIAQWTSDKYGGGGVLSTDQYMMVYLLLVFGFVLVVMARCFVFALQLARVSRTLHQNLLMRLMRFPLSFFQTTPSGRTLSLFSRDIVVVDLLLPDNLVDAYQCCIPLVITVVLSIYASYYMVIMFALLVLCYKRIQFVYRASARELQRLESIHRSPILSHVVETLQGLTSLRAFALLPTFTGKLTYLIDRNSMSLYAQRTVERWLAVRLESIAGSIGCVTALLAVLTAHLTTRDDAAETEESSNDRDWLAATLGMALTYAIVLPGFLNWLVRQMAELEIRLNSVERITHYCALPVEIDVNAEKEVKVDSKWPANGAVEFKNLTFRYSSALDPALHQVSFSIKGGSKVAVVGRTGAGKSTLLAAIFRLVPIEPGSILLDGVDICAVNLAHLRSKISIISQTPILFQGSVRSNLDPLSCYEPRRLLWALTQAQLTATLVQRLKRADKKHAGNSASAAVDDGEGDLAAVSSTVVAEQQVQEAGGGGGGEDLSLLAILDLPVQAGGGNFSAGQKQLLCLARALLAQNSLLVLDEATASVDVETDRLIQNVIRAQFVNCTVITIAHRLNTILDNDTVVVLRGGRVVEVGPPRVLGETKGTLFYDMLRNSRVH